MPKISVIVPVYKVEAYLERCVKSILAQTFSDFELILVDDGSPDNCPKMCDEWAKKDSRINVIHQKNGGLSAARNSAIDWAFANSNSEWLTFIDSDDWIHPCYLEKLYESAVSFDVNVSVCNYEDTNGNVNEIAPEKIAATLCDVETFYVERRVNATIACGKLYKKKLFSEIRYPLGKIHEDEFTTYRILFQHKNIAFIESPLYYYFNNDSSIMSSSAKSLFGQKLYVDSLDEQAEYFKSHSFMKAYNYCISVIFEDAKYLFEQTADFKNKLYFFRKQHKAFWRLSLEKREQECNNKFPKLMKIYWLGKAAVRKIFNKSK